jgi:adenine-specific DNA-methyltransferase
MPYNITRTELVWPGKYDENGTRRRVDRVTLPFQVIERVNESRATREAKHAKGLTLFDVWQGDDAETFEEGWRNKLIWGDNKLVMSSLLDQFIGKVDLIYIDPPFATGADFSFAAPVGENAQEIEKEQSAIEEWAYRDTWRAGASSYLMMLSERLELAWDLLAATGSLLVHCDFRVMHFVGALLDELFGSGDRGASEDKPGFRNEIVWMYGLGGSSPKCYPKKHDTILWYSKSSSWYFDPPMVPATSQRMKGLKKKSPDTWDIPSINNMADERTGYPTQKPEALLERIVRAHSRPGGLVADFFCGSGTTQAMAERLGRRWIGCDLSRFAIHVSRKRLLQIKGCRPFEVLNLGSYERRHWQGATFREDPDYDGIVRLYEYVAFILKLYSATPAAGMQHLHGRKGNAFVHVGAVDSPVTIDEIADCVEQCVALRAKELHVLGWEWEMGLHDPMTDKVAARGVRLVLRQIPREVMEPHVVEAGDVKFFELAYLDVDVRAAGKCTVVARLNDFVIPNPELVPDDVREKITRWSDYVDYWAVDWDFSEDTFMQGWVTYRTRKDRSLDLESDVHSYEVPGEYAVMVKVIDIFGNDTSKILRVRVD